MVVAAGALLAARSYSSAPAHTLLGVLVTVAFAVSGTALAARRRYPLIAVSLVAGAALWCLGSTGRPVPGPVTAVSEGLFWIVLVWAFTSVPASRPGRSGGPGRSTTALVAVVAVTGLGLGLATALARPSGVRVEPGGWWLRLGDGPLAFDLVSALAAAGRLAAGLAFAAVLSGRLRRLAPAERRMLCPLVLALGLVGLAVAFVAVAGPNPGSRVSGGAVPGPAAVPLALPAALLTVPVALALAAARYRLARTATLEAVLARTDPSARGDVQATLRVVTGDPRLLVLYPIETGYLDVTGTVSETGVGDDGWTVSTGTAGRRCVVVVHGPAVGLPAELTRAAVEAAALALENGRLQAVLLDQLRRVRDSRTRLVRSGLTERRRLERNLHDGAQQSLLNAATQMSIASLRVTDEPTADAMGSAARQLQVALDGLRAIGRDIYPPELEGYGLVEALTAMAEEIRIPVGIVDRSRRRADEAIELAAYLSSVDILTDAAQGGASLAEVTVEIDACLRVEVRHDGPFRPAREVDLTAVDDRLRALDGRLDVTVLGDGTRLEVVIPCA